MGRGNGAPGSLVSARPFPASWCVGESVCVSVPLRCAGLEPSVWAVFLAFHSARRSLRRHSFVAKGPSSGQRSSARQQPTKRSSNKKRLQVHRGLPSPYRPARNQHHLQEAEILPLSQPTAQRRGTGQIASRSKIAKENSGHSQAPLLHLFKGQPHQPADLDTLGTHASPPFASIHSSNHPRPTSTLTRRHPCSSKKNLPLRPLPGPRAPGPTGHQRPRPSPTTGPSRPHSLAHPAMLLLPPPLGPRRR